MNDEEKLLKILEIETNRFNHLDTILFNIKAWTATLVIGIIGFSFNNNPPLKTTLLFLAMGATIIFFLIDIYFRKIQLRHVRDALVIKSHLKSKGGADVWDNLWATEPSVKGNFLKRLIDYGYTFGVYALLLITLITIWLVKPS